ncbi:amino acid ABC transporter permease [Erwinia sp. S38]|uniref:amino acid ABC transporter permease n=1 Tax=Erwinia sp. S38 TaxID=2769338 RepID=UPI00190DD3AC|nr:amino acid ABC transporter permease [Erwinia sp. S38]MBK0002910.1 amino acid ABC transporter permease [Erwinia sp. S38]
MHYQWDFSQVFRLLPLLLEGLEGTLLLVAWSLLAAIPLGLLLAVLRLSPSALLRAFAGIYVAFFRSAPAIVLIYWFFFAAPILFAFSPAPLTSAVLAISLQAAAFFCEVFRAGIQGVDRGQWEAAAALNMRGWTRFRLIVLPQALRHVMPAFMNRLIDLIKTTTLASVIGFSEVVYNAGRISSQTFRPLETFTLLGGLFFVLLAMISLAARGLERRWQQEARR